MSNYLFYVVRNGDCEPEYYPNIEAAITNFKIYSQACAFLDNNVLEGVCFNGSEPKFEFIDLNSYIEKVEPPEDAVKEIRQRLEKAADEEIERNKKWLRPQKPFIISGWGFTTYEPINEQNKAERVNRWMEDEVKRISYKWKE